MANSIDQGPDAGSDWPAEDRETKDPSTGATVRQLTDWDAHDHHLYFTNSGWYDGGRRLLFGSGRTGAPNLFAVEVATGAITQLTDLPPVDGGRDHPFLQTSVNPDRPEAYFWHGDRLVALDLEDLRVRPLYEKPAGYGGSITNVTADGAFVCAALSESVDAADRHEQLAARPHSQIVAVPVDGGDAEVLHEEEAHISHVNTSPAQPELLTFCHEGPWPAVDQRIWGLSRTTGDVWKIRPEAKGEAIGHEYWLRDGETVGYHGMRADGRPLFGVVRYDNTERRESDVSPPSMHFHSNDRDLVVGDGWTYAAMQRSSFAAVGDLAVKDGSRDAPFIFLYEFDADGEYEVRKLARHSSQWQQQVTHAHPRFDAAGDRVVFTSDRRGRADVYLVDVPDTEDLPRVDGDEHRAFE